MDKFDELPWWKWAKKTEQRQADIADAMQEVEDEIAARRKFLEM